MKASAMQSHYDGRYFAWQRRIGQVGGVLNRFKFEGYIRPSHTVIDFGCGGGYLLGGIQCARKIGVEVNQACHTTCREENGIQEMHVDVNDVPDACAHVIISNHALEHVPNPLETLRMLKQKLVGDGTIVVVVPCEQPHEVEFAYKPGDINQHLHTWCPQSLGNLATLAGFRVESCVAFQHKWVADYETTYNAPDIHERCYACARASNNYQLKLVAHNRI